LLFFFSSRRRHTSFSRDWSSDVCSSDLRIDPRYDIYGIGFLCATMLAGEAARTQAQLRRWLANDSPLWRVIAVALDPDPENRFPSAAAMRRALRAAI